MDFNQDRHAQGNSKLARGKVQRFKRSATKLEG